MNESQGKDHFYICTAGRFHKTINKKPPFGGILKRDIQYNEKDRICLLDSSGKVNSILVGDTWKFVKRARRINHDFRKHDSARDLAGSKKSFPELGKDGPGRRAW